MVTIRRATLVDRPQIYQFIEQAYAGRWQYKIPERWNWEYVDNPFLSSPELPVWIAVEADGRVVGQTCTLVEPLKLGEEEHNLGWSVDTYLLPEYRGQGLGFQLQKANDEANPIFMSLSMTKANRKIKAGLGSIPLDPVPEYIRLVRYEPESVRAAALKRLASQDERRRKTLADLLRITRLDHLASAFLNAGRAARDQASLPEENPSIRLVPVGTFGEEADRLWEKVSPSYFAIVRRDSQYLNWKYVSQPHVSYLKFIAYQGADPCGYLILRVGQPPEPKIGLIVDIFTVPDDRLVIQTLLSFAVRYFIREKVKDVRAAASIPAYQVSLAELGFHSFREAVPMLHCKIESCASAEAASSPGCWFLGKGDHDWDQFPLAR